jgi:hypothetical protein
MVRLVRLALEEHWTAAAAARALLEATGHDQGVLRRVRAKVLRSSPEHATPVTGRALATLDLAIATTPER